MRQISTIYFWNSKNKFEKLVHLFGFIIRIYHDARSSEYQNVFFVLFRLCIFILICFVCTSARNTATE